MLTDLINTYEELQKYVFVIDRGEKAKIVIKFNNCNFYHLARLHKTNINMFFPNYIKSMDKKYKFLKKNSAKFDKILENQSKEKNELELRIFTFNKILDLLNSNNHTALYDVKQKVDGSVYDGDYALLKIYESIYCLLGLKKECETENTIFCAPQSWMASTRSNRLVENRRPIYMKNIEVYEIDKFDLSVLK